MLKTVDVDTPRPAAKHYGQDSEMPRCLSARKKLREHQPEHGTDSSGKRKETIDGE